MDNKPMQRLALLLTLLVSVMSVTATADTIVIHAGTLLAVPGSAPASEQSVIITDGRVVAVESGYVDAQSIAPDATLIDLSHAFVMPGLMDMHVHLQTELTPDAVQRALQFSGSDYAFLSVHNARKTLMAGRVRLSGISSSSRLWIT